MTASVSAQRLAHNIYEHSGGSESKKTDDEDKLVIDDDKDQSCSAAFSKENLHILARQVVSEVIGTFFLVATAALSSAQGLMLAPVAVGNTNQYDEIRAGLDEHD